MLRNISRCTGHLGRPSVQRASLSSLSQSTTPIPPSDPKDGFVHKRRIYEDQLTDLRKGYQSEVRVRKERVVMERQAEAKRLLIQKAILIREKKASQAVRTEAHKRKLEAARERYLENLAHKLVLKEKEDAKQQKRYNGLVRDLEAEKATWITAENMEARITEDLFTQPSTTGLTTKFSENWRYHVESLKLKRLSALSEEPADYFARKEENLSPKEQALRKYRSAYKLNMHDFLLPLVGTGEDRAKYKELVDKFANVLYDQDDDAEELLDYFENERELNEDDDQFDFRQIVESHAGDEDFNAAEAEAAYFDEELNKVDESLQEEEAYDESLEGAVSVIVNKDAREMALKAYKLSKIAKKVTKKGKKGK